MLLLQGNRRRGDQPNSDVCASMTCPAGPEGPKGEAVR